MQVCSLWQRMGEVVSHWRGMYCCEGVSVAFVKPSSSITLTQRVGVTVLMLTRLGRKVTMFEPAEVLRYE